MNRSEAKPGRLPRNIWVVSVTSFLTDVSSEMVINLLPLFLSNVLGVKANVIGLIEGVAESTASLLKLFSGWFSDRVGGRKWLAVAGYAISTLSKPFYLLASSWGIVAGVRWADRVGKGVRTAPRDALVADSITPAQRGLAFGLHRAADTAGAVVGLLIALLVVVGSGRAQTAVSPTNPATLQAATFRTIVLISLAPAGLAVLVLALGARDVPTAEKRAAPKLGLRGLGRPFLTFLLLVGLFDLGNFSDAFLVLRAQERGVSVSGVLGMLIVFNLVYALLSTPAGALSDKIGRQRLLIGGWLLYALIYLGFARAGRAWQVWGLYAAYGAYYGLSTGTAKALVADLVPAALRGTAYGTYNAVLGLLDLPASLIAGFLWEWLGPAAPFYFGAGTAVVAAAGLHLWQRKEREIYAQENT